MTNLCATHGMNIPDVGCPKCLKAENERLKETLACPRLTIDAPAEQFKAVLADWEKGLVVNSQDLLNALMWRLRNQAKEIARLHKSVDTLNAANRFLSEQLEAERSTHEPGVCDPNEPPHELRPLLENAIKALDARVSISPGSYIHDELKRLLSGGAPLPPRECNHDLATSNPTIIVDGKYDARCYVCKEEWHMPHGKKS